MGVDSAANAKSLNLVKPDCVGGLRWVRHMLSFFWGYKSKTFNRPFDECLTSLKIRRFCFSIFNPAPIKVKKFTKYDLMK